jgi:hypothetical protein
MTSYNLILITTHQDRLHITKLIDSIDNNIKNIRVLLIVVSQNCHVIYSPKSELFSIYFITEVRMGLSKARNIGLNFLKESKITSEYIMFPDDDSSFDKQFFLNFPSIIGSNRSFITPIYIEGGKDLYMGKLFNNNSLVKENMHFMVGSPNQVLQYNEFKDEIFFNEHLGVGAKYGSCEDIDLFIRLNKLGVSFFFTSLIYSFHPAKRNKIDRPFIEVLNRYKSYSYGFVYVVKKYRKFTFLPYFFLRPLGAAVIKFFSFDFEMSLIYLRVLLFRMKILFEDIEF